ncbi:hypothetical protein GE061_007845 [Apolygus lucorum]|uniref:Uncharacterized protein n=1 Tax=Apolygus lucorum TaxID=248454 RepID=A0A8S9WPP3_APOLU|nr:hypothetical protein GE061_007845 [Apolygus lucorum]
MMRDLQQALVADPEEVKEGDVISSLTFTGKKKRQEGFLDFLRTGGSGKGREDDEDSGRGAEDRIIVFSFCRLRFHTAEPQTRSKVQFDVHFPSY